MWLRHLLVSHRTDASNHVRDNSFLRLRKLAYSGIEGFLMSIKTNIPKSTSEDITVMNMTSRQLQGTDELDRNNDRRSPEVPKLGVPNTADPRSDLPK